MRGFARRHDIGMLSTVRFMGMSNTGTHAAIGEHTASLDGEDFLGTELADVTDVFIAVPHRPANPARAIFHVLSAVSCLALVFVLSPRQLPWVAVGFAGWAWSLETLRRISPRANDVLMRFFAPIVHRGERHRVNSATWYMTALVVLTLTYAPTVMVVGVAVLGFGDPAASLIGRRFGRRKLINRRTLEGSVAFVIAGTVASFTIVQLIPSGPAVGISLLIAVCASVVGAVAELLSRRVDDNFSIPLCAAATALVVLVAARVSPGG